MSLFGSFFRGFSFRKGLADETKRVVRIDRQTVTAIAGGTRIMANKLGFTHLPPLQVDGRSPFPELSLH